MNTNSIVIGYWLDSNSVTSHKLSVCVSVCMPVCLCVNGNNCYIERLIFLLVSAFSLT